MFEKDWPRSLDVIDSHTEAEPTRTVIDGWPAFAEKTMAGRREELGTRFDHLRRAVCLEPRGFDALVGAVLTEPERAGSVAGVVFFNNVGPLWMCGHGTIGVVRTLEFMGKIGPGTVTLDTPVGAVSAELHADGAVTITNVPAFCEALDVTIDVPGVGRVTGDVAWGGNWFFLAHLPDEPLTLDRRERLKYVTEAIRRSLIENRITGRDGGEIDHIELFGPPGRADADARNYVLCPGGEYDRSPCGTGTSAKMAVMHRRGKLAIGATWRQESITGSLFHGRLEERGKDLIPKITGSAYITARSTLILDPVDPFRAGLVAK